MADRGSCPHMTAAVCSVCAEVAALRADIGVLRAREERAVRYFGRDEYLYAIGESDHPTLRLGQ